MRFGTRRHGLIFLLVLPVLLAACNTAPATGPAAPVAQTQATPLPDGPTQPTAAPARPTTAPAAPTSVAAQPTARPTTATTSAPTISPAQPTATRPAATATAPAPTAPPTAAAQAAAPADACTVGAVTPAQTEGPYYKANPPQTADLLQPDTNGTKLVLSGYVFTADCKPVANARVDFWQADGQGQYDNAGYKLRGYQITDANGRYELETVIPGLYPGRTRHIHVKVSAPNGPVLTSQVYFPGEAANARDTIYNAKLLARVQNSADGVTGTFNFVLP